MRLAALLMLLAACGDDGQVPFDAPPDLPVDTLPGLVARGTIVAWTSPMAHGAGIAGARVCVRGAAHCVTTDATGAFVLDGVSGDHVAFTVDKAGYLRTLAQYAPRSTDFDGVTIAIASDAIAQQRITGAGGTYPLLDKAVVEAFTTPAMSGVTLSLAPAATAVYLGTDGNAQAGLTATSAEGGALFVGLAAGDYTIMSSSRGITCPVPVEAATLSYAAAECAFVPF